MNALKQQLHQALRGVGGRLGVNAPKLARHSFLVTVSHAVSVLRGIMTGYLVARLFPRDLYGQYQLVLSALGVMGAIGVPDLYKSIARAIARGKSAAALPVAKYQLFWCIAESIFLLCALPFLHYFGRAELVWPFVLAAFLFPVAQVSGVLLSSVTVGAQNFVLALRVNFITTCVVVVCMLVPLFVYPSIITLLLVTTAIPAIIALLATAKNLPPNQEKGAARSVFWYGLQLSLLNAPITLSWYLDKFLISRYYGLSQLAVFSVALLLPEQFKVWAGELLPITFASQSRGSDSRARRLKLLGHVALLTIGFAGILACYIVAAPYIFAFFFPNYLDAIFFTQFAAATLITVPSGLLNQYLEAQAMVRALRYTRWLAAIVFCAALITLVPTQGILGALIARGLLRLVYALCAAACLLWAPIQIAKPEPVPHLNDA